MEPDQEDTGAPPNKRVKTLTIISPESSPPSSSDKGKSKLEVSDNDEEDSNYCCGICLYESEYGNGITIIRGFIDCCDHYFCFVCIMEWSKIESKCPMCKRRFSTIRRPRKLPVFPFERVINVPVRDQVYHYQGNVTTGPDMYADVECNVCHGTTDDSLLLLCDLCDTAYHTYCVGLGATVPEGDWFCADCSLLKAELAQSEIKTDCDTESSFSGHHITEPARHVSIYEIVRESDADGVESSLDASDNLSHIGTRRRNTSRSSSIGLRSVGQDCVAGHATKFNARTLGHCRNVHQKIRALREHWNGFRRGSLRFPSGEMSNASIAQPKPKRGISRSSQPMTSQSCDRNKIDSKGLMEVNKAWKMLDMAKAIEQHERKKSVCQASKHTVKKNTSCKEAGESCSKSNSPKVEQHQYIQDVGHRSHIHSPAIKLDRVKLKGASSVDKGISTTGASGVDKGISRTCGPSCSVLVSFKESQTAHGNNGLDQKKKFCAGSKNLISSTRLASTAATIGYDKEICSSSNSTVSPPQDKQKVEKSDIKSKVEVECHAKIEIQSLVKLNLKILCRDKKLEVGLFKQVARLATHSILAACGLEHRRPGVSSLPESVCSHVKEDKEVRKSNLMPSSCRECFFLFVKNVVNAILLENS